MEHGHLHFSGVIRYGDGEEAGILVVHVDEIDAVVGLKSRAPVASSGTNRPTQPGQSVARWIECAA